MRMRAPFCRHDDDVEDDVKLLLAALALSVTQATADDVKVTVPASALEALIEQNEALREDNKKLDEEANKWFEKYRHRIGMVGNCT